MAEAKKKMVQTEMTADMYRQTKPCDDCPFRKDAAGKYTPQERLAYARHFLDFPGSTFPCHKSVPKDDDRSGWSAWREGQTMCAGGLILSHKLRMVSLPTFHAYQRGWFKPDEMQDTDKVVESVAELLLTGNENV